MLFEEVMTTWRRNPELATLLGTLIGMLTGFRLSIAVDRRKEYNAAADIIRHTLLSVVAGNGQSFRPLDDTSIDILLHCSPRWRRSRIRKALQAYSQAGQKTTQDAAGQVLPTAPQEIRAAGDQLLRRIGRM